MTRALGLAQFARLCIEAEAMASSRGGSHCTIKAPGGQVEAGSLDVLIGSHRIHSLIGSYMKDPVGAAPLPSRPEATV